jgi:hypothetical protein
MWRFSQVKAKNAEILDVFRVFLTLNCGNKHYLEAIYHYGALPKVAVFLLFRGCVAAVGISCKAQRCSKRVLNIVNLRCSMLNGTEITLTLMLEIATPVCAPARNDVRFNFCIPNQKLGKLSLEGST